MSPVPPDGADADGAVVGAAVGAVVGVVVGAAVGAAVAATDGATDGAAVGAPVGAVVGAVVGARVGIRAWPWAIANDTWFAEIGRRLVRGPDEVRDLPIPYAVEHHLMSGGRPGFH
jgi:hypothetical protein